MVMPVASRYQDELKRIKKNIETAYLYFKDNYDRYNDYRKFIFQTSMSSDDIALLKELQKPQLEFNILEAYVSRLRGEFSKQEPSFTVRAADGLKIVDPRMIDVIEQHLRAIMTDANSDNMEYDVYTDTLSGGFSVMKVYTDYVNEMSFDQNIHIRRAFDPTLCGFDPLATTSHKGDGRYCFELYPKSREELEQMGVDTEGMKFARSIEGFNWNYQTENEEIVLVCDYYEKKTKRVKIVKLVNNQVMPIKEYTALVEAWNREGIIAQPPAIVGKPRWTELQTIVRYRIIESRVLEYVETNYKYLPLIFVDGNSVVIRNGVNGAVQQMTRPYVFHAKGVQKLKNFAGQTLANELENMVMHKFKVPKDAIPNGYEEAYMNVQKANVLIYNQYKDNDVNIPLNPPEEIQRVPTPPEVTNTFKITDEVTQMILGSFDADLAKMNQNQVSGIALQESATLSNSASMPYIVGFMKALNQAANIMLDLIPKYYVTPRTIPMMKSDGKREYQLINAEHPDSMKMEYPNNALEVKVTAGVNFSVQKSQALSQVIALMQASPLFAQFMNTSGLNILLDNIDIRGIDQLKEQTEQWQKQMQQIQQQQMQQQQNQPNPEMMKAQLKQTELQQKAQKQQSDLALSLAKLKQEQTKLVLQAKESEQEAKVQRLKAETERFSKEVELQLQHHDMRHRHVKETIETKHMINESKKERKESA